MHYISRHISYREATYSKTATRYNINNTPDSRQLNVMRNLADNFFEPLRALWGVPIFISSFYRSRELNENVGGALMSHHMILGNIAAIDIDQDALPRHNVTNNRLFYSIFECLPYYKMIAEFPNDGKISWLHISFSTNDNKNKRRDTYIAIHDNGVKYIPYIGNEKLIL